MEILNSLSNREIATLFLDDCYFYCSCYFSKFKSFFGSYQSVLRQKTNVLLYSYCGLSFFNDTDFK